MIATVFKRAEWGLYLMVALIPLPNVWYKFYSYPMGKDYLDLLFLAIVVGIILQQIGFTKKGNSVFLFTFIVVSYIALWNSSTRFSLPLPITHANRLLYDWKNYAQMIFMYFLTLNIAKDEKKQEHLLIIISVVILFLAVRSYRAFTAGDVFSYESRYAGPFWIVKLGANHFGAFFAHYWAVFLGLFVFEKIKWRKMLFLAVILFGLHPIFFSYSRGAYIATFCALVLVGILKKRSLLIIPLAVLLAWHTILPPSVIDRIEMTFTDSGQIEHSAAVRLDLWNHAIDLYKKNPIFGVGFGGYGYTMPEETHYTDTHNFYLKTLSEQGIVGLLFLVVLFYKAFFSGFKLYKIGRTPFHTGLGLGFIGCILAVFVTNLFGERWSYMVLNGYFWVFWGLVDRSILNIQEVKNESVKI